MMQRIGGFLRQSIMPNISAFIAWGLLTALFTENGWLPNAHLAQLTGPMLHYALPLMIAYTGGRHYGGERGGAIGILATMGLIVGVDVPMILGAMLMGPLAGWLLSRLDEQLRQHIPLGFEMLSFNYLAAFLGVLLAVVSYWLIGPLFTALNQVLMSGVTYIMSQGWLFLSALLIEPGKVLFLNNALNHGVLSPLGMQLAENQGASMLFLLETNPGPGLGVLLATMVFGAQGSRRSAGPAAVIHLVGGIHEIYFPYVLMQPLFVCSLVLSGLLGNLYFQFHQVGLVATPSPGSLLAILTLAPRQSLLHLMIGILLSAAASFLLSALILKMTGKATGNEAPFSLENLSSPRVLEQIYVACDAGMGSSALGAAMITRILAQRGIIATVRNVSLEQTPEQATLVVTHMGMLDRARLRSPNATILGIRDFLNKEAYEEAMTMIINTVNQQEQLADQATPAPGILERQNIFLGQPSVTKEAAILRAGKCLMDSGYVAEPYIEGMLAREAKFTTYIGNGVAIPHGENTVKQHVKASGIVVFQYPEGIDFGEGKVAYLVIGIAGVGNDHIHILSNIAEVIDDESTLSSLFAAQDPEAIYRAFSGGAPEGPYGSGTQRVEGHR